MAKMTPTEADFIARGKELLDNFKKDMTCKSCHFWRPANVKLFPAHCMNPFNDNLINIFNPHGFDQSNLRQVLESKHNSSCQFYKFEKGKYDYLAPEIDKIMKRYEEDDDK